MNVLHVRGKVCPKYTNNILSLRYKIIAAVALISLSIQANAQSDSLVNKWVNESVSKLEVPKGGVVIGDSLPEAFWDLKLKVSNDPRNRKTIDLKNYKNKLLILDFWATYCVPCVKSIDSLNALQQHFDQEIAVLPIHLYDYDYKAGPFALKKGWKLPIVVGNSSDTLLNRLFYAFRSFGEVWIKDGKLLAIPKHEMATVDVISSILTNRDVAIEMNDNLTYFDKRYQIGGRDQKN